MSGVHQALDHEAVQRFFDSYVAAFIADDVDGVTAHWAFPSVFSTARGGQALEVDGFRETTREWCAFYRRRGVASASKRVIDSFDMGSGAIAVTTHDTVCDSAGTPIADWRYGYVLRVTEDGPKLIATIADDELRTWAKLGTPMGS